MPGVGGRRDTTLNMEWPHGRELSLTRGASFISRHDHKGHLRHAPPKPHTPDARLRPCLPVHSRPKANIEPHEAPQGAVRAHGRAQDQTTPRQPLPNPDSQKKRTRRRMPSGPSTSKRGGASTQRAPSWRPRRGRRRPRSPRRRSERGPCGRARRRRASGRA